MKTIPQENTGRVVALALAFFGALALIGWSSGVFSRLSDETLFALVVFAIGFAGATYALDDGVRGWVNGRARRQAAPARKAPAKSPARTPAAT